MELIMNEMDRTVRENGFKALDAHYCTLRSLSTLGALGVFDPLGAFEPAILRLEHK
jgi:hypothetical protein